MEKLFIGFLAVLFTVFVVLPGAAYFSWADSYVAWKIWQWHLASLGFLPTLTWKHLFGLSCVIGLLRRRSVTPDEKKTSYAEKVGKLIALAAAPWFVLLVAWIFT